MTEETPTSEMHKGLPRHALYQKLSKAPLPSRFGDGQRVNDFICCSKAFSHVYLLESDEGSVLINTGMGMEAPVIAQNLRDVSEQVDSIHSIITTQGHVDHVGGVAYFKQLNPNAKYIAHEGNQAHQQLDERIQTFRANRSAFRFGDIFTEAFKHYSEHGYNAGNAQDKPITDITFSEQYTFSSGNLDIVLYGLAGAETNDSLIVWLPQHRICLTGNIFGCLFGNFPNLVTVRGDKYRDALVVAEAAQFILDLQPEMILYGRHEPIIGSQLIAEEVTAIKDATLYVHDEVVKGMNAGKSLHELMQNIQLPAQLHVGERYGKVAWSVRAIWENYAGWFHHQSTTELYSLPQSSIYTDLLELAGVEALLQRAKERFEKGDLLEAQHILDIVIASKPENTQAKDLSIAIHQQLLTDDEAQDNFWLSGWLENQIKLLQKGL